MKLTFNIDSVGKGTIAIDDQPVENNVSGVEIRTNVGKPTIVMVTFGMVDVEGEIEADDVVKQVK